MKSGLTALLSLALGAAMVAAPSVTNFGADAPYDLAFAAKGGNGKSYGGGSKSNGGGSKSASASTAGAGKSGKTNLGATASALGALNAGHASATALANALAKQSTSRVGLVAAYGQQNMIADQLATAAADAAAAATATAALPGLQATAAISAQAVADAELAGLNISDTTAYDALVATRDADAQAVADAQATIDAAAAAQAAADAAEAEAVNLLNAAANKTPVSEDTRAALDALLEGKITAPPAP
jgi:hypothetical protein